MAPNGDPHTGAHYTRSNPSLSLEGMNKSKGTASSTRTGHQVKSQGRTTPNTRSRGGDEEAVSLAGVGTRSRSGGRRRALITDFSDDEEKDPAAPPPSQSMAIREKSFLLLIMT
jgi:hypothetical protein